MQPLRSGEIKLNSVTWTTKLPHFHLVRNSPNFVLNGAAVRLTITSNVIDDADGNKKQYWYISLGQIPGQSNIQWRDRGILSYLRKKDDDFMRFTWNSEKGSGQLDSAQLSTNGLTADDEMCMIFVFNMGSELSEWFISMADVEETVLPTIEKPSIHALCLQEFSENIEKMFDKSEYSDAVVKCGGRSFYVHKTVLSARSEVLAAMFRNKMSENQTGIVEIEDMETPLLEKFLRFLYSGRLDVLSMDTAFDLYKAGDKYAVPSLIRKCASFMLDNLSVDSVCQVLLLAHKFSDAELLDAAINFVASEVEFVKSAAWNDFGSEHPAVAVKVYQRYVAV